MIKDRIKEILKERGLTQKDLAEKLNVKQETISRQISGNPTLSTLKQIAEALDMDIRDMFVSTKHNETETIYVKRNENYMPIGQINQLKDIK